MYTMLGALYSLQLRLSKYKSQYMEIKLLRAKIDDLDSIVEIYNWAIINTTATFDTQVKTVDSQRSWLEEHDERYPVIVAKGDTGEVVGWASLTKWSDRCAYADTGEISFYVHPEYHGKKIGTKLLSELLKIGTQNGLHTLVSRIADGSEASIKIHKNLGFFEIGVMREVGHKFGKIIDITLMQILLK